MFDLNHAILKAWRRNSHNEFIWHTYWKGRMISTTLSSHPPMKEFVLITSGTVGENKRKEFEQTVKFVLNHVPAGCTRRDFSIDLNVTGRYHLLIGWDSLDALNAFKSSDEVRLLQGAIDTLGGSSEFLQGTLVGSFQPHSD